MASDLVCSVSSDLGIPWPGTLCCVLGQDALVPLSTLVNNEYLQM